MLEPVRQYALERLVATGGYADIRQRHLLFCIAHGEIRDQDTNIGGSRRLAATAEFAQQYPDTRLALTWALESQQTQLGFRLARTVQYFWEARGYWTEGSIWLEKLFLLPDADEPTPAGVVGLLAAGRLTSLQGRFDAAAGYYERSLPLARRAEEPYVRWLGPQNEGLYHADRGDLVHAAELFREARATAAAAGDRIDEGISLATLAFVAWSEADFVNARSLAEKSLHVLQQAGEEWAEIASRWVLGVSLCSLSELSVGRRHLEEAVRIGRMHGDPVLTAYTLEGLGWALRRAGRQFLECEMSPRMEGREVTRNPAAVCRTRDLTGTRVCALSDASAVNKSVARPLPLVQRPAGAGDVDPIA